MTRLLHISFLIAGLAVCGCHPEPTVVLDLQYHGENSPAGLEIRLCNTRCSRVCGGKCIDTKETKCTTGYNPLTGTSATVAIFRPDTTPFDVELQGLPCVDKKLYVLSIDPSRVIKTITLELCKDPPMVAPNCCDGVGSNCGCEFRYDDDTACPTP